LRGKEQKIKYLHTDLTDLTDFHGFLFRITADHVRVDRFDRGYVGFGGRVDGDCRQKNSSSENCGVRSKKIKYLHTDLTDFHGLLFRINLCKSV